MVPELSKGTWCLKSTTQLSPKVSNQLGIPPQTSSCPQRRASGPSQGVGLLQRGQSPGCAEGGTRALPREAHTTPPPLAEPGRGLNAEEHKQVTHTNATIYKEMGDYAMAGTTGYNYLDHSTQ